MKRYKLGCLAAIVAIPLVLGLIASIWWIVGYTIIHCVNYLAQSQIFPNTHTAYLCAGLLLSIISGTFKVTIKKD